MQRVRRAGCEGQATVELALALPIVALLAAALVEVGNLARAHALVWHAAREAGRAAAVEVDREQVEQAAARAGLSPVAVTIDPPPDERVAGDPVSVTVAYQHQGTLPVLGHVFATTIEATAAMRIERP